MSYVTRISLIEQMQSSPQSDAWRQFVDLYGELVLRWLINQGVQPADAEDVRQEVLSVVANHIVDFQHNGREGAFRCWLKRIMANRLHRLWSERSRREKTLGRVDLSSVADLLNDDQSRLSLVWHLEHDRFVLNRMLQLLSVRFDQKSMEAFVRIAIHQQPAQQVADGLNMSLGAARVAQHRVLKALKAAAADFASTDITWTGPASTGLQPSGDPSPAIGSDR